MNIVATLVVARPVAMNIMATLVVARPVAMNIMATLVVARPVASLLSNADGNVALDDAAEL
jgi:hypothetical protein